MIRSIIKCVKSYNNRIRPISLWLLDEYHMYLFDLWRFDHLSYGESMNCNYNSRVLFL